MTLSERIKAKKIEHDEDMRRSQEIVEKRKAEFAPVRFDYTNSKVESRWEKVYNENYGYFGFWGKYMDFSSRTDDAYRNNLRYVFLSNALFTLEIFLVIIVMLPLLYFAAVAVFYVLLYIVYFFVCFSEFFMEHVAHSSALFKYLRIFLEHFLPYTLSIA